MSFNDCRRFKMPNICATKTIFNVFQPPCWTHMTARADMKTYTNITYTNKATLTRIVLLISPAVLTDLVCCVYLWSADFVVGLFSLNVSTVTAFNHRNTSSSAKATKEREWENGRGLVARRVFFIGQTR